MIYKSYVLENDNKILSHGKTILFYGENLGLKNYFKNQIINLNPKSQFLKLLQEDILKNNSLLFNELNNLSLFTDKKILLIDNCDDKIFSVLEKYLENRLETQIIFFSNLLDKRSKLRNYFEKSKNLIIIPCYPDNSITIKKIIFSELKGFQGLSNYNINIILESSNNDRIKLKNEIEKIKTFFLDKKIITEQLEKLLNITANNDFNILKDEVFLGNKIQTNKLLGETIFETEKNIYYLNSINQRLNKLSEILKLSKTKSIDEALTSIKPPIFWKDKPNILLQIKNWNITKIKSALNKTYNLEIEIKSNSVINKDLLMKKLLIDICEISIA